MRARTSRIVRSCAATLLLVVLLPSGVSAQTAFGIRWYGEIRSPASPRTLALGGLTAVSPWGREPASVGSRNPALLASAERVLYGFSWEVGRINGSYGSQSGVLWQNGPRLMGLVLPIGGGFAFGGGLQRITTNEFEVHTDGTAAGGVPVKYDYVGTGGLSQGIFTAAWRHPSGVVAAGVSADLIFGSFKQEWLVNFEPYGYVDTSDRVQRQHRGNRWTVGMQIQPLSRLRLGGAVGTRGTIRVKNIHTLSGAGSDTSRGELRLGETLMAGVGFSLNPQWAVYADYRKSAWDRAEWLSEPTTREGTLLGVTDLSNLSADWDIGVGVERQARELAEQVTALDAFPLRAGVRVGSIYAPDLHNGTVSRWYGTLGTAVSIGSESRAWADITLQFGGYTATGAKEFFWRIQIGITGAERWFLPPQR